MNTSRLPVLNVERLDICQPPASVGESPVWHAQEQALYWVDIPARRIVRHNPATGAHTQWTLPQKAACIAFGQPQHDRQLRLVAGMESGIFSITLPQPDAAAGAADTEASVPATVCGLAAPQWPASGMRFNDGRCDRQGRFWAGTMAEDMAAALPLGALFRLDAQGYLGGPLLNGLIVPNGLAWSPEGTTMYLSDSHPQRRLIWAFDYDVQEGQPRRRRLFADLHHHMGRPDGAAVDADGCYWICANDAGAVLRFTPKGALDRVVPVPPVKPSMCAFGGAGLDTLFVTSIRPATGAGDCDGHVFALRPGVCGLQEPCYAGGL